MRVVVDIKNCGDCRHLDHSGAFTPGGAKDVCDHRNASSTSTLKRHKEKWHWKNRVVRADRIPSWCPLKAGGNY